MENLTHSLLGATLAELALPAEATKAQRRIFFATGVIASNLPDADLLYSRITPNPLGYLLHHRGHTHTLVGVAVQALLVAAICLIPSIRRHVGTSGKRLATLIIISLLGHILLDSWNSYGVHPFWPFDNRWFYGDSIFILEPWLWLLFGVAATSNTRNFKLRVALCTLLVGLIVLATYAGQIGVASLVALALVSIGNTILALSLSPKKRAAFALGAVVVFVTVMFGASHAMRAKATAALPARSGRVMSMIMNPQAANPFCWTALAITKNVPEDAFDMRRATVGLVTAISRCGMPPREEVVWEEPIRQSLSNLQRLAHDDCWVNAWLRFGRAPLIRDGLIDDYRFRGGGSRSSFSAMSLDHGPGCPANIPPWVPPRADLLN